MFDGIQLYKEEFGSSYTRDEDGNIISVKDLQGQTTTYEYQNNDLTKAILPTGAELSYTYDDHHNVLTATSEEGITYGFTYDTYGNNLSVAINSGEQSISTSATYSTDGNRMETATDAAGNTTGYSYDENTNVLNWVQYPGDTERTQYTYDSLYRLANTTAQAGTEMLTATYGYTEDLLTTLTTGSSTYYFTYGDFSLRDSISVGDRELASYDYTAQDHQLSQLTYGNGDTVSYTYDDQGRVTAQTYNNGDTVTYTYDNTGALASVYDSATGRTTTYYYDFTDRLMKYTVVGQNYNHSVSYEYDTMNNLSAMTEIINGVTCQYSYTYDADNRISSVTVGDTTVNYSYDAFGRTSQQITKHGETVVLTETATFHMSGTNTTGQIASYNGFTYTYDAKGNISSVTYGGNTTAYTYDSAGQLTRENNQAAGKTWVWTYDDAGNILSKTEYAYTTDSLGEPLSTISYGYTDPDWGDLLTSYNGNTITYDEIGNPLSDGTWNYTWQHGRQLASMSNSTTTWNFSYNSDGLRTQKTNGTTTYNYIYNGSSLSQMSVGNNTLRFFYDTSGIPVSVDYNGITYYYATNIQGDVMAILDATGVAVVEYTYDAWGKPLTSDGVLSDTLGQVNPLRYCGYIYDSESGLYYLQSRYYNPAMGRFLNADSEMSGIVGSCLGKNQFTYCFNNPVILCDKDGNWGWLRDAFNWVNDNIIEPVGEFINDVVEDVSNFNIWNTNEEVVTQSNFFSFYKGKLVIRTNMDRSGSFGVIFLSHKKEYSRSIEETLKHEYGHTIQLEKMGIIYYSLFIAIPSALELSDKSYYAREWEVMADIYGGVELKEPTEQDIIDSVMYNSILEGCYSLSTLFWKLTIIP